ncbi:MAG: hypothetical protein RLZZ627_865 [Pseudomonadota bacterium]|jgi:hypothetical protein
MPESKTYRNFLLLQMVYMVSFPLLTMQGLFGDILELTLGVGLLSAGLILSAGRKKRVVSTILIALLVLVLWTLEVMNPQVRWLALTRETIFILFFARVIFVMAHHVFLSPRVKTSDRLYGAVSIYLMISAFFGSMYTLTSLIIPNAFDCTPSLCGGDVSFYLRNGGNLYFSLITLTTLGYGDITPVYPFAGMLSSLEALIGQMYVAVVVARLVGLHLMENQTPKPTP